MFVIVILAEISVHLTAFFNQMLAFNFQKSTMFFFSLTAVTCYYIFFKGHWVHSNRKLREIAGERQSLSGIWCSKSALWSLSIHNTYPTCCVTLQCHCHYTYESELEVRELGSNTRSLSSNANCLTWSSYYRAVVGFPELGHIFPPKITQCVDISLHVKQALEK